MRLRVTASAQFMASAYGCSGEHVRRRDRDTQLETPHPVSPLVHNLAVPAGSISRTAGRFGCRSSRAGDRPSAASMFSRTRPRSRSPGWLQKQGRLPRCVSRSAQYIPAAPKCAPVCADADLTGLAQSIRGIALRISCSHAGAMHRRPFLCARNRLAVVAVCNTTRYR